MKVIESTPGTITIEMENKMGFEFGIIDFGRRHPRAYTDEQLRQRHSTMESKRAERKRQRQAKRKGRR